MLDKAPPTVKAYVAAFKRWHPWATELKLPTRHSAVSYRRQAHAVRPAPSKGHRKQEPPSRLPPGGNVLLTLPGTGEASP